MVTAVTPEGGAAQLLALDRIDATRFVAACNLESGIGAIFGGQPLAQALAAAGRTVANWPAHSLSTNYLRMGVVDKPIEYAVEIVRDGRRYASRRVVARQGGRAIFDMLCAFHDPDEGPHRQSVTRPLAPAPDTLESAVAFVTRNAGRLPARTVAIHARPFPVELRPFDPEAAFFGHGGGPARAFWFRLPSAARIADPRDQQCLLAFMSDYWFAGTAALPHADGAPLSVVTLNHAMWFHAPVRTERWLLYDIDSPWAGHGRGLARGAIYDEDGTLLASTAQEVSIRPA